MYLIKGKGVIYIPLSPLEFDLNNKGVIVGYMYKPDTDTWSIA